jgi:hypothetical protein
MPDPAPRFDVPGFLTRCDAAARRAGFAREVFGEIEGHPLVAYSRAATSARRRHVYVSTGMHGDEPAPPWALLEFLEHNRFDRESSWTLCPVLNPTGLARGTRENFQGLDLNRDYKGPVSAEVRAHVAWLQRQPRFTASFCLHEDYEANGFYLYELNPDQRPSLAAHALAAAVQHCPIEHSAIIDGRESAEPGIIRPVSDPLLRDAWPEAIYLREHHTTLSYTFESPTSLGLAVRIAALAAALRAALDNLRDS